MTGRQQRSARDAGETLIEILFAMLLLGSAVVVLISGLAASVHTSKTQSTWARSHDLLTSAADQAMEAEFLPCGTAGDYNARWAPTGLRPGVPPATFRLPVDVSVASVAQWIAPAPSAPLDKAARFAAIGTPGAAKYATKLAKAVDANDTTLELDMVDGFPDQFPFQIKVSGVAGEFMTVTSKNPPNDTVRVVARGGAAFPHALGDAATVCPRLQRLDLQVTAAGETHHVAVVKRGTLETPGLSLTDVAPVGGLGSMTFASTAVLAGAEPLTGRLTFHLFVDPDPAVPAALCAHEIGPPITKALNGAAGYSVTKSVSATRLSGGGRYRWIVAYSGDAANQAVTTACPEAPASLLAASTVASDAARATTAKAGDSVTDLVTLDSGQEPPATGSITFLLYDSTCTTVRFSAPPAPVPHVPVAGGPAYESAAYVVPDAGDYFWVAAYSGDAHHVATASECVPSASRKLTVTQATPTIDVTGAVTGASVHITGTLMGGAPVTSGTVTLGLYAEADTACGSPLQPPASVGVGASNHQAEADFPLPVAGTYRVGAVSYSGDPNNAPITAVTCGGAVTVP